MRFGGGSGGGGGGGLGGGSGSGVGSGRGISWDDPLSSDCNDTVLLRPAEYRARGAAILFPETTPSYQKRRRHVRNDATMSETKSKEMNRTMNGKKKAEWTIIGGRTARGCVTQQIIGHRDPFLCDIVFMRGLLGALYSQFGATRESFLPFSYVLSSVTP